eukprot:11157999-Lingulodinium_polyedra.AAC.1
MSRIPNQPSDPVHDKFSIEIVPKLGNRIRTTTNAIEVASRISDEASEASLVSLTIAREGVLAVTTKED